MNTSNFTQRLLSLITEANFLKFYNILNEPNIFKIVGRTHYERWHSCFFGWLLDPNGSHLMYDYVLTRLLLLSFNERCLPSSDHQNVKLLNLLPSVRFQNVEVIPNEYISTEASVKDVGRFDIFLTADYQSEQGSGKLNIIFELKIDSRVDTLQSKRYADWLLGNHSDDLNLLIYILPQLGSDAKSTVGDSRWYCMDYQLLHDSLLLPVLEHPNLNPKVASFIVQYVKNLKILHNGVRMAITQEEKKIAVELYEKYNDVFDAIFDALKEADVLDYSTSDINSKGRKSGRLAIKIDGSVLEGDVVRTLFQNVLIFLVDKGHIKKLPLPWGISSTRYVLTSESPPRHPNGRNFFYPVNHMGYFMESHYSRERGLVILENLCRKLEVGFESLEV
jgi:PD-(D/E)XK nuclease superfamily